MTPVVGSLARVLGLILAAQCAAFGVTTPIARGAGRGMRAPAASAADTCEIDSDCHPDRRGWLGVFLFSLIDDVAIGGAALFGAGSQVADVSADASGKLEAQATQLDQEHKHNIKGDPATRMPTATLIPAAPGGARLKRVAQKRVSVRVTAPSDGGNTMLWLKDASGEVLGAMALDEGSEAELIASVERGSRVSPMAFGSHGLWEGEAIAV